ncbi:DsbE family thiol:disulfide interchange protein [Croceicoccus naphthovorans]|uniref:Alkyl hydroperoxide reductase n=1 Tax=Croceicoccus naphthovorans TaxID=1348774 RepID=A0A0G3XHD2_9SPHN|nr:DsbE family thiol:disulfide interchange protein [Croceicoccus naphthovorans]AKM10582.1 alkyl hydroperoxide reductase [Croceicoccus naphthovorans]MBB3988797.1 cytochrome c biogenesis protein CcmG/thiol:disulfide interchange protein DsbE [Croceicoccus naphthovorans]
MSASTDPARKGKKWAIWLPLVLFGAFFVLVMNGLVRPADREIESAMVGKALPEFDLPPGSADRPGLSTADFRKGSPRLLNVFASWCVPCAAEAPQLDQLARAGVEIDGVAIRDREEDIARFLSRHGNPFARIGKDDVSEVQLGIGSSGVPETFIIDGSGTIRYQHIGPIMDADIPILLGQLKDAEAPL